MDPLGSAPPWQISLSSTRRGIYAIRYLLFSGGAAIAAALLQRATTQTERPLLGLLVGLLVGLVLFVSQLQKAAAPSLLLSQETLYLAGRRHSVALPWNAIASVSQAKGTVTLHIPEGTTEEASRKELVLSATTLGIATTSLHSTLQRLAADPQRRSLLPTDLQLHERMPRLKNAFLLVRSAV